RSGWCRQERSPDRTAHLRRASCIRRKRAPRRARARAPPKSARKKAFSSGGKFPHRGPERKAFLIGLRAMKLSDLKIIVTGGASGMGRHFAVRLVEAGAQVAIGDVNEAGLTETAGLAKGPGKCHAKKLNVADEADVHAFVEWAHGAMGGLNGLVNNAGILRDGLLVKKDRETGAIKTLTKEQWDAVIGVNLTGATLIT